MLNQLDGALRDMKSAQAENERLRAEVAELQSTLDNIHALLSRHDAAWHRVATALRVPCTAGVDYPEHVDGGHTGETVANAAAVLHAEVERKSREADNLRRDLQAIARGCGVGHPDPEEAIKRVVAEVERLRALAQELWDRADDWHGPRASSHVRSEMAARLAARQPKKEG